jgi:translation elongation factor EF-Tu-like GTPase
MTAKYISVEVSFLREDQGGRSAGIVDRYRAQLRFEGAETEFGTELRLPEPTLERGERSTGTLRVWAGEFLPPLAAGRRFELREGSKIVARGVVTSSDMRER